MKYFFFDTETTGLIKGKFNKFSDYDKFPRIVEIAWVLYDDHEIISENRLVIKPDGYEIPTQASDVHGITTEMALEQGIPMKDAMELVQVDINKADALVAHNLTFDQQVLAVEFHRLKMNFSWVRNDKTKKICTMKSATDFVQIPSGYGSYKWPKLQELHVKLFEEEFTGAHSALDDIKATARCFWGLVENEVIKLED